MRFLTEMPWRCRSRRFWRIHAVRLSQSFMVGTHTHGKRNGRSRYPPASVATRSKCSGMLHQLVLHFYCSSSQLMERCTIREVARLTIATANSYLTRVRMRKWSKCVFGDWGRWNIKLVWRSSITSQTESGTSTQVRNTN